MAALPSRFSAASRSRRPFWVILVALTALFMYRWLGPGLPLSPRGESQIEIGYLWMLRRLWAQGDGLRGWNPYLLSGVPTAISRSYSLFLPLAALSHLLGLSPETIFRGMQWLATCLSGLGMYRYVRHLSGTSATDGGTATGGSSAAAVAAAAIFAFFPARIMLTAESMAVACVWAALPWTFWAYERIHQPLRHGWRSVIVWALPLAWILIIDAEWLALLLPILALYIALRELCGAQATRQRVGQPASGPTGLAWTSSPGGTRPRMLALVIPVTVLLVVALGLFHLLPGLIERHLLWKQPGSEGLPILGRGPVPLGLWIRVLGQRWGPGFAPMAWDLSAFPNMTWYLGVIPCLLAIVGLLRIRHWPTTLPLVSIFGVAMLLSAGPTIPLNLAHLLLERIPWVSQPLQNAWHYVWPASLALAALAGLGVDRLCQILGMDWRASTIGQLAVGLGIMALVVIDFWPATQAYGVVYQYLERDEIEAHLWLDEEPGEERYWVPLQPDRPGRRYTDTSYAIRYNRRPTISVNEYHLRYAPHRAALFYGQALQGHIEEGELPVVPQSILDLANVRYLVLPLWPARYEKALTGLPASGPWRVARRDQHIALFENAQVWPYSHAYARGAYAITWEDKKLLESLPWFLARGYALVEAPKEDVDGLLGQGQPLQPFAADSPQAWATVRPPNVTLALARPKATEIWIRFQGEGPFLLMISETWYPHWRVYVNDARQPLLRLNGNYVGVYVNARAGHVLFRYRRPFYLWLGWAVSALTALGLLVYALRPQPVRLRPDA